MAANFQTTFSNVISFVKMYEFWLNFYRICFQWSDSKYSIIGLYNRLAPNRQQAIIWNKDGLGFVRIYVSLGLKELEIKWKWVWIKLPIFKQWLVICLPRLQAIYGICLSICAAIVAHRLFIGLFQRKVGYRFSNVPPLTANPGTLLWIRISNHMSSKGWDKITYPFPNVQGARVEVLKWISNFIHIL